MFGSTNAIFTVISATQITAVSPGGMSGAVDITVITPGGTSATGAADQFTYVAPTATVIIDPNDAAKIYAGLDGAGVFISANSGASWAPATTQPTNLRIKALVITPGDSTKLYAATYGGGVYQSANSGVDWSACANTNLTNLNLVSLTIDATGRLYAGTEAGVFVSNDNCASWNALNTGLPL
jgi:ligand-binding sensor domain-containing protein